MVNRPLIKQGGVALGEGAARIPLILVIQWRYGAPL